MDYRIWAVVGIVLLIAELFTPSFFLVFFGIGGIITAITTGLGLTPGTSGQFAVFSLSSLVLMVLFRNKIRLRAAADKETMPPDYLGQRVKVSKRILPGDEGAVLYRGSQWIAFLDASEGGEIAEGTIVEVVASDGVRLKVKRVS